MVNLKSVISTYSELLEKSQSFIGKFKEVAEGASCLEDFDDGAIFKAFGKKFAIEFSMVRKSNDQPNGHFLGQIRAFYILNDGGYYTDGSELMHLWFDKLGNASLTFGGTLNLTLENDDTVEYFANETLQHFLSSDLFEPIQVPKPES